MAILVSFFGGDSAIIRRCLASGGWPPEDAREACGQEVGFKFGVMPEQAFDSLIISAAQLTKAQPFRFENCVDGKLAENGESLAGPSGRTPLTQAVGRGAHEAAAVLLAQGTDINARGTHGFTALGLVVQHGHQEMIKL